MQPACDASIARGVYSRLFLLSDTLQYKIWFDLVVQAAQRVAYDTSLIEDIRAFDAGQRQTYYPLYLRFKVSLV